MIQNKNNRQWFLKKINRVRIITGVILGIFITLIAASVTIYSIFDEELHVYSFAKILFIIVLMLLIMVLVLNLFFFKSYTEVLRIMNDDDLQTLIQISESRFWLEKYLPSFIIYSGKIRIFTWLRQPDFYFSELKEIQIKTNIFTRGRQNKLVIFKKTKGRSFFFSIDSNPVQRKHLLEKAVVYHPEIIIKGDLY